jgi:hypothetical protein
MIVMSIPAQFQMEHFCRADLTALHLFVPYCRLPVRRKIANKVVRWRRFRDLRAGSCIMPTLSRAETMHSLPILCLVKLNIFQYDIVEMKIVKHDAVEINIVKYLDLSTRPPRRPTAAHGAEESDPRAAAASSGGGVTLTLAQ